MSTIGGYYNHPITITTTGAYTSPLTISATGYVKFSDTSSRAAVYGALYPAQSGSLAVDNEGRVVAGGYDTGYGILLNVGLSLATIGIVSNEGTISAFLTGIEIFGPGAVADSGLIEALGTVGAGAGVGNGVHLYDGGSLSVTASGTILGSSTGAVVSNAPGTVDIAGKLAGQTNFGLRLSDGGSATIEAGGIVSGGTAGFALGIYGSAGEVTNTGSLSALNTLGPGGPAVVLADGGIVTNNISASIIGMVSGIDFTNVTLPGTLDNSGLIRAATNAVFLSGGGYVDNAAHGTVTGGQIGVDADFTLSLVNSGTISGTALYGVKMSGTVNNSGIILSDSGVAVSLHGGFVSNASSGTISSNTGNGVIGSSSLVNAGLVEASGTVIDAGIAVSMAGGAVENQPGGRILGSFAAVEMRLSAGTVTNFGSIGGGTYGVELLAGGTLVDSGRVAGATAVYLGPGVGSNLLTLEHGYSLSGAIVGGTGVRNTLELSGSLGPVTVDYAGLHPIGFQDVLFASGGLEALAVASTAGTFPLTVSGFTNPTDVIDLTGVAGGRVHFSGATDTLTIPGSNGTVALKIDLLDRSAHNDVVYATGSDGTGGTNVRPLVAEPLDILGQGDSDLLWQNGAGQVMLWVMVGDTVTGQPLFGPFPGEDIEATGYFDDSGRAGVVAENASTGALTIAYTSKTGPVFESLTGAPAADSNWVVVATGDFNGDGHSDLLWQNSADGTVRLSLVNGLTVTTTSTPLNPGAGWHVTAAGDFNGDGKSDVVAQYEGASGGGLDTGDVAIALLNGTSFLAPPTLITFDGAVVHPGANWHVIAAADFNGDSKADLVAQNSHTGDVAVALMNGATAAAVADIGNPGAGWTLIGAGEFGGDPQADLFFQDAAGDQAQLWQMSGTTIEARETLASTNGGGWLLRHG